LKKKGGKGQEISKKFCHGAKKKGGNRAGTRWVHVEKKRGSGWGSSRGKGVLRKREKEAGKLGAEAHKDRMQKKYKEVEGSLFRGGGSNLTYTYSPRKKSQGKFVKEYVGNIKGKLRGERRKNYH